MKLALCVCVCCLLIFSLPPDFFFVSSKKSKYTSTVRLQGAELIICQWFAPFLFKSPELMTMSLFKRQNLLPWIYKTGPLIWVTISLMPPPPAPAPPSLNSSEQPKTWEETWGIKLALLLIDSDHQSSWKTDLISHQTDPLIFTAKSPSSKFTHYSVWPVNKMH